LRRHGLRAERPRALDLLLDFGDDVLQRLDLAVHRRDALDLDAAVLDVSIRLPPHHW
jgi:hypothetical protein